MSDSIVGNIYWFESQGKDIDNTTFREVQGWKENPGRGKSKPHLQEPSCLLLTKDVVLNTASFDNGICSYRDPTLPCHSTFQIPFDIAIKSTYRIYWFWDYSGKLGNNTRHTEACSITNKPFEFIMLSLPVLYLLHGY